MQTMMRSFLLVLLATFAGIAPAFAADAPAS